LTTSLPLSELDENFNHEETEGCAWPLRRTGDATAVLTVDEPFKCSRFKKQANTYVEYQCLSQMPRTVHSILTKQFLLQGTMVS